MKFHVKRMERFVRSFEVEAKDKDEAILKIWNNEGYSISGLFVEILSPGVWEVEPAKETSSFRDLLNQFKKAQAEWVEAGTYQSLKIFKDSLESFLQQADKQNTSPGDLGNLVVQQGEELDLLMLKVFEMAMIWHHLPDEAQAQLHLACRTYELARARRKFGLDLNIKPDVPNERDQWASTGSRTDNEGGDR